MLLTKQL